MGRLATALLVLLLPALATAQFAQFTPTGGNRSGGFTPANNASAPQTPASTGKACYVQAGNAMQTCTWTVALAPAETATCWVTNLASATYSVSDAGGNIYTANGALQTSSGALWSQMFYTHATATAATTSVNIVTGSASFNTLYCTSYTSGSGVPDGAIGYNHDAGSGNPISVNITTSTANSLEVCFGAYASGGTYTISSGFTLLGGGAGTNIPGVCKLLTGSGTFTATATPPGSGTNYDLECGGYK